MLKQKGAGKKTGYDKHEKQEKHIFSVSEIDLMNSAQEFDMEEITPVSNQNSNMTNKFAHGGNKYLVLFTPFHSIT